MSIPSDIAEQIIRIVEKVKQDLSEHYATKEYVDGIISSGVVTRIVNELPETGDLGIIYLVPVAQQKNKNKYKEYIYINGAWEDLGSTELNLADYYNKDTVNELLSHKMDKDDSSIPTKMSDLVRDAASYYLAIEVRNTLPSIESGELKTIYLIKDTYRENEGMDPIEGLENNYIKYIKVFNDTTNEYQWEVLGNPDHVTLAYINENYYKKGEIYTETDVVDAIDACKAIIDAEVE